jgi:hypothetical protein
MPLLDLLSDLIAHHIVANPGVPCQQELGEAPALMVESATPVDRPRMAGAFTST